MFRASPWVWSLQACLPWFQLWSFYLLPFCSDFSAVKNVAGECAWDGVTEGSSGIPTDSVHLVLAILLGLLCLFCLWNPALSPPCKPSLFFKRQGPGDVAWCGFLVNSAALLSSFISRAPFFLLFLAKIHQAWQVEGSTPGLFHKLSLLLPSWEKCSGQPCSKTGLLLSHVRSCTQKHTRGGAEHGGGLWRVEARGSRRS